MVTLDENDLTEEEDVQSKIDSLKSSLSQGEIPEDLKNFITSLQEMRKEESNDSELLDDDVVSEGDEEDEEESDDSFDDSSSSSGDDIEEDVNGNVDDLNELF